MSAAEKTSTAGQTEQELVIIRIFDAPRELVFKAWTEPEYLRQWWGPSGYTTPHCKIDLHPGGKWQSGHRLDPIARVIFLVRQPVDRVHLSFDRRPVAGRRGYGRAG